MASATILLSQAKNFSLHRYITIFQNFQKTSSNAYPKLPEQNFNSWASISKSLPNNYKNHHNCPFLVFSGNTLILLLILKFPVNRNNSHFFWGSVYFLLKCGKKYFNEIFIVSSKYKIHNSWCFYLALSINMRSKFRKSPKAIQVMMGHVKLNNFSARLRLIYKTVHLLKYVLMLLNF